MNLLYQVYIRKKRTTRKSEAPCAIFSGPVNYSFGDAGVSGIEKDSAMGPDFAEWNRIGECLLPNSANMKNGKQ